jgi:hypothetical protein
VRLVHREVIAQDVAHRQRHVGDGGRVVRVAVVEAARHHVGVADGLDLLQAEFLGQLVEGGEDAVEHGEHLGRRHALGDVGEVHDVGEHHGHVGEAVGDGLVAALQPLGHRAGQDVEQQPFRSLLLDLQQAVGLGEPRLRPLLFDGGEAQQQEDDGRHRREVEREEHHRRPDRNLRLGLQLHVGQVVIEGARHGQQEEIGDEPGEALARADEEDGPHRRQQAPDGDAAGGDEVADAPLHDEGKEQEQRQLADAEEIEIAPADVDRQVGRQQDLEGERQVRGKLRPEAPVDDQPQHRGDAGQAGGEHQQRLVQPQFVAVAGVDAGRAQPVEEAVRAARH